MLRVATRIVATPKVPRMALRKRDAARVTAVRVTVMVMIIVLSVCLLRSVGGIESIAAVGARTPPVGPTKRVTCCSVCVQVRRVALKLDEEHRFSGPHSNPITDTRNIHSGKSS